MRFWGFRGFGALWGDWAIASQRISCRGEGGGCIMLVENGTSDFCPVDPAKMDLLVLLAFFFSPVL